MVVQDWFDVGYDGFSRRYKVGICWWLMVKMVRGEG